PGTELVAYRERRRPPETKQEFVGEVRDSLTERQLTALQTAYVSGYYEPNRRISGDDLAASMGVARSTFHQHLRSAERKVIGRIFELR
ncbi:MAG: helix-turn-helix domain-containing protein, partial [Halobacteriales archaeon]|nr:helix-turn-helix domain-containing protein [Halobacteriales archaeon]